MHMALFSWSMTALLRNSYIFVAQKSEETSVADSAHNLWKIYLGSIKISWNENAVTCDKCKEMAWKCYAYSKHRHITPVCGKSLI